MPNVFGALCAQLALTPATGGQGWMGVIMFGQVVVRTLGDKGGTHGTHACLHAHMHACMDTHTNKHTRKLGEGNITALDI